MKEFSCASMNNNCSVTLTAPTDERLVELASIHLREVHGMTELSAAESGRMKQLFINRLDSDAAYVVDRIFEKYNCESDPACTWRYIAEAETILSGGTPAHQRELKAA